MSIIIGDEKTQNIGNATWIDKRLTDADVTKLEPAGYQPTEDEARTRQMVLRHFSLGFMNQFTPRREFGDLSLIGRLNVDKMAFNSYQPNNGEPDSGDITQAWRSNAMRPIVRNKCISIAAHATARLIFPKVFARDSQSNEQNDAAKVMESLMEFAGDDSNYPKTSMEAVITSLWSPASIVYTEYSEVYRNVKRGKEGGKWKVEKMKDEVWSGFKDRQVAVDELLIENFYESNIQKQPWLIWRRVINYDSAAVKYSEKPNWAYVKPGMQTVMNEANYTFYYQYDPNMRPDMVEEVIYWNKQLDVRLVMVNGILLTDWDEPNPREDKLYPFVKFGYELVDEGRFFYYKSLAYKMQQDAGIINTLYPMIIDGTYLSIMPPMVLMGQETVKGDVMVPGAVTTFQNRDTKLQDIESGRNLNPGYNTLSAVEKSLDQSSQEPIMQGADQTGDQTAYQISRLEQNAATVLGLFVQMIAQWVKDYGHLKKGDILQYMTILDADKITDDPTMVYKSFVIRNETGKSTSKVVKFSPDMPMEPQTEEQQLEASYKVKREQDSSNSKIYRVNPELWRKLDFSVVISPDVIQPRSEELERAMKLELYDRAVLLGPAVDQEKIAKDFLFGAYRWIRNPDEYMKQVEVGEQPMDQAKAMVAGRFPVNKLPANSLPQTPSTGGMPSL